MIHPIIFHTISIFSQSKFFGGVGCTNEHIPLGKSSDAPRFGSCRFCTAPECKCLNFMRKAAGHHFVCQSVCYARTTSYTKTSRVQNMRDENRKIDFSQSTLLDLDWSIGRLLQHSEIWCTGVPCQECGIVSAPSAAQPTCGSYWRNIYDTWRTDSRWRQFPKAFSQFSVQMSRSWSQRQSI